MRTSPFPKYKSRHADEMELEVFRQGMKKVTSFDEIPLVDLRLAWHVLNNYTL